MNSKTNETTAPATFEEIAEVLKLLDCMKERKHEGLVGQVLDLMRLDSGTEASESKEQEVQARTDDELRLYIAYWQVFHFTS